MSASDNSKSRLAMANYRLMVGFGVEELARTGVAAITRGAIAAVHVGEKEIERRWRLGEKEAERRHRLKGPT